jgi:hypothetical protein
VLAVGGGLAVRGGEGDAVAEVGGAHVAARGVDVEVQQTCPEGVGLFESGRVGLCVALAFSARVRGGDGFVALDHRVGGAEAAHAAEGLAVAVQVQWFGVGTGGQAGVPGVGAGQVAHAPVAVGKLGGHTIERCAFERGLLVERCGLCKGEGLVAGIGTAQGSVLGHRGDGQRQEGTQGEGGVGREGVQWAHRGQKNRGVRMRSLLERRS